MTVRRFVAGLSAAALLVTAPAALAAPAPSLDRPSDPVVVSGAQAPALVGVEPGKVVAFAWRNSRWAQVPVQVDERKQVDLRAAYPATMDCGGDPLCYQPTSTGPKLRYADAGTLIGPDPNPRVDADDEVALMARDTGPRAPAGTPIPAGVVTGLRQELAVTDPLNGARAYVYLFRSRGALRPGAGKSYVDYRFQPGAGAYPAGYSFASGPERRVLHGHHAVLPPLLLGPLARVGSLDHGAGRRRRERAGSQRGAVRARLLRAHHADLRARGGGVPGEPQRPGARHPVGPGGQQRPDVRAPARVLRPPHGRDHVPEGAPHPGDHELLGLQRRGLRDEVREQQQPGRRDRGRHPRRRHARTAELGVGRRRPGRAHPRLRLGRHGERAAPPSTATTPPPEPARAMRTAPSAAPAGRT